jgi:hypothetical protein
MSKNAKKVSQIVGKVDAVAHVAKNGYPEVGQFIDEKSLQKFYKQLDTKSLEDWAALEGLTYKACPDSEPIHRMRVAMAILYKHFPKDTTSKPESPYKKYTLEQLVSLAVEHEVPVEPTDDDRILRMRTIMALRAHKVIS